MKASDDYLLKQAWTPANAELSAPEQQALAERAFVPTAIIRGYRLPAGGAVRLRRGASSTLLG